MAIERISLYYPAINIPNSNWLRSSILYTDKVASIFPFEKVEDKRVSSEIRFLYDKEEYKPISVFDDLRQTHPEFKNFENAFFEILLSKAFKKSKKQVTGNESKRNANQITNFDMYVNKLTPRIAEHLKDNNLLSYKREGEVAVDKTTSIVYMSMLSDFLACVDKNKVTPSTDQEGYENLAFVFGDKKESSYKLLLQNCLPVPKPNMELSDIIKFKRKRKDELINFRLELEKMEKMIIKCQSDAERKDQLLHISEQIDREVFLLTHAFGDSKIQFALKSFSSLLNFKDKTGLVSTIAGTGLITGGALANLQTIGTGSAGVLLLTTLVSSHRKLQDKLKSSSYSYLYQARRKKII